ncbi:MAG: hypothetical protein ACKVY0_08400 [Prosthecobacter sp.]|uniref:hypothetical protein n=1 Tax=Prosthecobacter sp. TaxID=1965333 RepID=UPI0039020F6E
MINPFKHVNWRPDTAALRSFAKSLLIGFPIISLVFLLWHFFRQGDWNFVLPLKIASYGAGVGLLFLLLPVIARPFYCGWYALSCTIGLIVSNVLLSVFYYTIFTLIGLLRRTLGRSPIRKEVDRTAKTYWNDAVAAPDPVRYFSQS